MARVLRRAQPLLRQLLRPLPPLSSGSPSSSTPAPGCCYQNLSHTVQLRSLSAEGNCSSDFCCTGERAECSCKYESCEGENSQNQMTIVTERKVLSKKTLRFNKLLTRLHLHLGRVIEIYGPEASGKTTLALHVIAEAQKTGGYCAFIDAEHALDPTFAESIGVKAEHMLLSQPDCGEQALGLADILIRSGSIDVVVVDSVAALVPKTELDGEMGDAHVALQARLMSQALRKLSHSLSRSRTILLFVNQLRSKLSTFSGFGAPAEVTCGGNALKFYASVRLNTKRVGLIKKSEEVVGTQIQVKIVKNKHAPPFKTVQLELEFGKGLSRESEIIELGLKHKFITKSGLFYHMNGLNFHGKDAIKHYLAENRDGQEDLMAMIREKIMHDESQLDRKKEDANPDTSLTEEIVTVTDEEVHDELDTAK
ncbi:uncharacterized protein LOC133899944 isoform X2 [Phragmites australis]|uniref:uncharacterized protein LOC133899944 isoform X2 n=1 Tax=Phragmites australis TaxID=29695 RepID=UPI002D791300|nr:uncharacterized protein LOC133899944 isoform X2 [Phragmites australis]